MRIGSLRSAAVLAAVAVTLAAAAPVRAAGPSILDGLAGPAAAADLEVMTFNLRYASTSTPNSWAQRRPVMRTMLTTELPDLIGTQEGLAAQLRDIESDLGSRYDFIGQGREGGTRGEYMAIFFDNTMPPRRSWSTSTLLPAASWAAVKTWSCS